MTLARDQELRLLDQAADRRDRRTQDLRDRRVLRRDPDGTTVYQALDGTGCPERGGVTALPAGTVTRLPATPEFSTYGLAGSAVDVSSVAIPDTTIERLTPRVLERNSSVTVTATGRFGGGLTCVFGLPWSRSPNQGVTVSAIRVLTATEAEIDLTVDAAAPILTAGKLHYDGNSAADTSGDPVRLAKIRTDAYDIVEASVPPTFLVGFGFTSTTWTAYDLDAAGAVIGIRAVLDVTGQGYSTPNGYTASMVRLPSAAVALAWKDGERTIRIWRTDTGVVHSHTAPNGFGQRWVTAPLQHYATQQLHWVEMESDVPRWDLMAGTMDLAGIAVQNTIHPDAQGQGLVFNWLPKLIAETSNGFVAAGWYDTLDAIESVTTGVIPLTGNSGTFDDDHDPLGLWDPTDRGLYRHHGTASYGNNFATTEDGSETTLRRMTESPTAFPAAEWPTSGAWDVDTVYNSDTIDGQGLIYTTRANGAEVVIIAPLGGPYTEPTHEITLPAPMSLVFFGA